MTITVQSTSKLVTLNGVPARIWEGVTETGIPIHCYITRVGVGNEVEDQTQFQIELRSHRAPSAEIEAIPLRMLI